ncbi:GNAT family N-acetyltransferase [Paenibacillus hexagrammi]|uniref:GNAT family N-acetyltransferase n=1 Tax=Paenibacillus hexagrammi TaxID=2908839 RepID=A0ABY3SEF8_9BACL|nr:GNAT family N-acetyltransferase [Paenibacillus sp. YPD9-1]UJF31302.1 GNAT family N-acetyltransferase [Paenibacillus sp. YPD9-1]
MTDTVHEATLIDIKSKLQEAEIQELLGCSVFPDPDRIDEVVQEYQTDSGLSLYGYVSEDYLVGLIGFRMDEQRTLTITHIAVKPDSRGAGFGRGIILETIELLKPSLLLAETDEEAVDFYRSIGFVIISLGEKVSGMERFLCRYEVEEEDS